MLEWLLPISLVVLVVMASLASDGWDLSEMRNRENWLWAGVLMVELACVRNPYVAALLAVYILGWFKVGRSSFILRSHIVPVAAMVGAYLIVTPHMQPWMIPVVLWAGVAVGVALGAWAILSMVIAERPYGYGVRPGWWGIWYVHEPHDWPKYALCGQSNMMHLMSVTVFTVACAVGLVWMGQWWAACALPFCALPILASWRYDGRVNCDMGSAAVVGLVVGVIGLSWPILGVGLAVLVVLGLVVSAWYAKAWTGLHWYDSGRLAYWRDAIVLCWWPPGWKHWLTGYGSHTWFAATLRMGETQKHPEVFTQAHNEYVQQLLEHGLIGLVALLAYLGSALWRTYTSDPSGQAVFLLGLTWCIIACVNFPASWVHEHRVPAQPHPDKFGSPTLNAWTFVIAVLAEAV